MGLKFSDSVSGHMITLCTNLEENMRWSGVDFYPSAVESSWNAQAPLRRPCWTKKNLENGKNGEPSIFAQLVCRPVKIAIWYNGMQCITSYLYKKQITLLIYSWISVNLQRNVIIVLQFQWHFLLALQNTKVACLPFSLLLRKSRRSGTYS